MSNEKTIQVGDTVHQIADLPANVQVSIARLEELRAESDRIVRQHQELHAVIAAYQVEITRELTPEED